MSVGTVKHKSKLGGQFATVGLKNLLHKLGIESAEHQKITVTGKFVQLNLDGVNISYPQGIADEIKRKQSN